MDPRTYRIADESPERDAEWKAYVSDGASFADLDRCPSVVVTWDDLAQVNDPETMEAIAEIKVGERTVLGMCDPIERLT